MTASKIRYLVGVASLATGAALLTYFLAGLSLRLSLGLTGVLASGSIFFAWRRLDATGRRDLGQRAIAGLLSGLLATAGYDASRYFLVRAANLSLSPFEAWKLFGQLLAGDAASPLTVTLVGTAYHLVNGVCFAIGYTLVFGYRGWKAGIAWALVLEILMVSFYPGWLGLQALDEFLSVTFLGHVVYGLLLGWSSRVLLTRYLPRQVEEEARYG